MELFSSNVEERAHRQVSRQIRQLIVSKKLRRGDALPKYDELCEKFRVCPVTLKRALDELYKEQLIFSRRGKGVFVNREIHAKRELSLIGLVYSYSHQTFFSSPYLMEIFQGIMLEADAAAAGVRAFSIKATQKREQRVLAPNDLEEGGVDGAILVAVHNQDFIATFAQRAFGLVVVDNLVSGVAADFVVVDNEAAVKTAIGRLRAQGHRHIAYLDGWTTDNVLGSDTSNPMVDSSDVIERREAYRAAMREQGMPEHVFSTRPAPGDAGDEAVARAVADLKALRQRPTAVVTYGDSIAVTLIDKLKTAGLRVPQDISIAAAAGPGSVTREAFAVASNRVPFVEMGRQAVRILQQRCKGAPLKKAKITRIGAEFFDGSTLASAPQ